MAFWFRAWKIEMRGAFRNTAQAGDVVQLIDHDRVGDVSLHAGSLGDLLGDQAAEIGGVFALGVHQVVLRAAFTHIRPIRSA